MTDPLERADALRRAGRPREALASYEALARERVLDPDLWRLAGRAAGEAGEHGLAARYLAAFVRVQPGHVASHYHLGESLFALGDYPAAADAFDRAAALRPDSAQTRLAAGIGAYCAGRAERGAAHFTAALAAQDAGGRIDFGGAGSLALLRVVRGDWARGWREFEERWRGALAPERLPDWRVARAPWDGAPDPRPLYLHADGGHGDVFLFARYFPEVARRVGRLVVVARRGTWRLVRDVEGVADVVEEADLAADALHASMWALPWVLGSTPDAVSGAGAYLRAPADGPRLPEPAPGTRLRAGLVWAGDAGSTTDVDRSCPSPTLLAPLFQVPGVEWTSLQVGPRAGDGDGLPLRTCPALTDFADTAHVLAQLDLVVSVDTAVANLALALGVPTVVLVPTIPEFRWPPDHPSSPWFPAARVVRRAHVNDWTAAAARAADVVRERLAP